MNLIAEFGFFGFVVSWMKNLASYIFYTSFPILKHWCISLWKKINKKWLKTKEEENGKNKFSFSFKTHYSRQLPLNQKKPNWFQLTNPPQFTKVWILKIIFVLWRWSRQILFRPTRHWNRTIHHIRIRIGWGWGTNH